jgi:uncharacterized membrane protein YGL010W
MRKSLREYLLDYEEEHKNLGTKLTHMIGIPMIVAALPIIPFSPALGIGLFVLGWIFQLIGHAVFEHNKPSFTGDWFYLLIGPVWVAIEFARLVGITLPFDPALA